jgi:hypothetical protein
MFSAEFQRNLWLEFSLLRLIAAPAIVVLLVGVVFAAEIGDTAGAPLFEGGSFLAYAVLYVWGGWLAASAVLGEINAQTWESQRMSALGAWSMTWGKLFGATSYAWYAGILFLGVAALGQAMGGDQVFDGETNGAVWLARIVLSGLLVQAAAFAAGLVMAGKVRAKRRGPVLAAWVMGMAAGSLAGLLTADLPTITAVLELGAVDSVYWYDGRYNLDSFALISLALFVGFAVFAGYRLMRRELQFRSWPWGLPLFGAVIVIYICGFPAARLTPDESFAALFSVIAFGVTGLFLYLSAFLDRNDPIRYRSLLTAFGAGRWREALALLPWWIPQVLLGLLAMAGVLLFADESFVEGLEALLPSDMERLVIGRLWAPAFIALALRDVGYLLWLNMGGRFRRPDVSALVYLLLFYGPVQALFHLTGLEEFAGLFFITPGVNPFVTVIGGLVLAAVFFALAIRGARGKAAPPRRRARGAKTEKA